MKYRRGRRGFWWWTWLLVLFVLADVYGGRMLAEKKWAAMPKEYQASSILMVKARPAFTASAAGTNVTGIAASELSLIAAIRDQSALARVAQRLNLPAKWKMNPDEVIRVLRAGIETISRGDEGEVGIRATMHSAEDAKNVANMAADVGAERVTEVLVEERGRALLGLDEDVTALEKIVTEARDKLAEALAKKGVNVTLTPKSDIKDLRLYFEDPNVQGLAMAWDHQRQLVPDLEREQSVMRTYWSRTLVPPSVLKRAELPQHPSGPDKAPFLRDGSLYGLIIGLVLGLIAMFLCWKFVK